jgi:hypothetical protein
MKWLIINTEAFSPAGLKRKKVIPGLKKKRAPMEFNDLPWVIRKFLSAFNSPFIILDESSKIKTTTPTKETNKSSRTQLIKLLNKYGDRAILTATLMSKSPLNTIDQYEFLQEGYFEEDMWEFAEKYCVMTTLKAARGRRVIISKKIYESVRKRLKNAYISGGEGRLKAAMRGVWNQYGINHEKQEHIIRNRKYTPYLNEKELLKNLAPCSLFIKREDIFDITYDKFVKEPIARPVELSKEAKKIANDLIKVGFSDNLTLGKVPALELQIRLQDICNGFEPVETIIDGERKITYKPFKTNPKLESILEWLEEIDIDNNQAVLWCSRKLLIKACAEAFDEAGISYVIYDGSASNKEKAEAERKFKQKEVQVFLVNQGSGAYGLNCLTDCDYGMYICVDGSVEGYYQSYSRMLRGQLKAPKFMYALFIKGSIEERQWDSLRVGQELIGTDNRKEIFIFK